MEGEGSVEWGNVRDLPREFQRLIEAVTAGIGTSQLKGHRRFGKITANGSLPRYTRHASEEDRRA